MIIRRDSQALQYFTRGQVILSLEMCKLLMMILDPEFHILLERLQIMFIWITEPGVYH